MIGALLSIGLGSLSSFAVETPTAISVGNPIDYKKFRDPFKQPTVSETEIQRSDLERFAVADFKVVAIITGPLRMRAMIVAPDSKTHYIAEKMKIGIRDGIVVKITTKTIVVREKVVNPLGEVEFFETEMRMDPATVGTTQ